MWGQHGDHGDVQTMWGQHEDNVETTWGPWGCGDHMMETTLTMWRQHQDHRDMESTWGQHEDNLDLIEIIQFCLKIYDLLTHPHPHLWVDGWVNMWVNGWGHVISIKIK